MPKLYIIRHAQVEIDPQVPSEEWRLSEAGIHSTQQVADRETWDDVTTIYHSPEPKAKQTAKIIAKTAGLQMRMCDALRELSMNTGFLTNEEFQARVAAYFAGEGDDAFERYEDAQQRIVSCVRQIVAEADGHSVALVTHGRILTVLYSYLLKRRLHVEEWRSIQMPDLSVIDLQTWQVERGFLSTAR